MIINNGSGNWNNNTWVGGALSLRFFKNMSNFRCSNCIEDESIQSEVYRNEVVTFVFECCRMFSNERANNIVNCVD